MNSDNTNTLYQRAGEIIVNKYNNIKDIPDKYLFFYKNYIPLSIGQKRKYEDDSIVEMLYSQISFNRIVYF